MNSKPLANQILPSLAKVNDVHPKTLSSKKATLMSTDSNRLNQVWFRQTHNNSSYNCKRTWHLCTNTLSPNYGFNETASRKNGAQVHDCFPPGGAGRIDGERKVLGFYKGKKGGKKKTNENKNKNRLPLVEGRYGRRGRERNVSLYFTCF